jgi:CRISPR-associated protein Csd1
MLHAILDYARQEALIAEPGLKPKTVRWLLMFSPDGRFLGVQDLKGDDRTSKGREFPACPDLTQQEMVAAGAGCRHFLVDGVDVVALLTKDGTVDDKLAAKHAYFVNLLEQAAECLSLLKPIAATLNDDVTVEAIRNRLIEGKAKPTDLATPAVLDAAGPTILVEHNDWHAWWQTRRGQMAEERRGKAKGGRAKKAEADSAEPGRMLCHLSGELVAPLPTHNKIEGLSDVGGLSMGDALTSFDKDAFTSFGLQQGANAAMSETMVKTYVSALNHLIRYRSRRLAGAKVVYWYSGRVAPDDDPLPDIFDGFGLPQSEADDEPPSPQAAAAEQIREQAGAESRASRLLRAIDTGEKADLTGLRYFALTLSANSGRVVIRDWMEGAFSELLAAIDAWFRDLTIISRDGRRQIESQKLASLIAAPLRDLKDAPSSLSTSLWRCALKGYPIPHNIMAQTLQRVRLDFINGEPARHARFALLKAFCNRTRTQKMTVELNEHETDPAYLCGRILALLARIQDVAMPGVGAGILQRYYGAASVTPSLVLGRLVRLAQIAHLPKVGSKGLRHWFEKQLADVWCKLDRRPPSVLTPEEQTLFAMGYYHQYACRYQGTDKDDGEEEAGEE